MILMRNSGGSLGVFRSVLNQVVISSSVCHCSNEANLPGFQDDLYGTLIFMLCFVPFIILILLVLLY